MSQSSLFSTNSAQFEARWCCVFDVKKKSLPNICLNSKFLFSDNCPENQTDVYSKAINKNLLFADPDKEQHIDNLFHS